jgi:predicted DNA-binding transcriptional regulator YafY
MQGIRRLPAKFDPDLAENWTTQFESVFGITSRDPKEAVKVVLSFRPVQGRYVQALPLHQSQTTILENENEIRISLRIAITHDFIMELLSYGAEAEVISPRRLRSQIARLLNDGSKRYEKPQ